MPEEFNMKFYKYRELIRDESLIALGMLYLLNGIMDIRDMVPDSDFISITQNAILKKTELLIVESISV